MLKSIIFLSDHYWFFSALRLFVVGLNNCFLCSYSCFFFSYSFRARVLRGSDLECSKLNVVLNHLTQTFKNRLHVTYIHFLKWMNYIIILYWNCILYLFEIKTLNPEDFSTFYIFDYVSYTYIQFLFVQYLIYIVYRHFALSC